MKAIAVIGANYGDEGKGMATDYFVRKYDAPLVARCNGGGQAGHTVVDGEKTHVFSHVGAGTFAGAKTYLSEAFIVNPRTLARELTALAKIQPGRQVIYAHPNCRVSTAYDMAINSLVELKRDKNRHGSCGMGINETVTRDECGFSIIMDDLVESTLAELTAKVRRIRNEWVPLRLLKHDIKSEDFEGNEKAKFYFNVLATSPEQVAEDLMYNGENITVSDPTKWLTYADTVVIEGAQGLMLDEFLGEFPYVTRSITGLASSMAAAEECGCESVTPVYMTRSYLTRHGAGHLENEGARITDRELFDSTNVHNQWQGTLRYAPLDLDALDYFISEDLKRANRVVDMLDVQIEAPVLFVTCMDQLGKTVVIKRNSQLVEIASARLIQVLQDHLGLLVVAASFGPSAKDVASFADVL